VRGQRRGEGEQLQGVDRGAAQAPHSLEATELVVAQVAPREVHVEELQVPEVGVHETHLAEIALHEQRATQVAVLEERVKTTQMRELGQPQLARAHDDLGEPSARECWRP